jgi:imidazole glycerol-phosphate synthase subunit HisH
MKKIVIVDYGLGNLYSIAQACTHIGYTAEITRDQKLISNADYLILPGVGAFGIAMQYLTDAELVEPLKAYAASGRPLMGICLGMQLLFDESEEFGQHQGLGFIKGEVKRFPSVVNNKQLKVPNIGWIKICQPANKSWNNTPLAEIDPLEDYMYFVHSYYTSPAEKESVLSITNYNGFEYASSVMKDNIWGFQFHPEKSSEKGLTIYKNFFNI